MKQFQYFDFKGKKANEWVEVLDEHQFLKQHLTREIISQYFEKEKQLRSLSGDARVHYRTEYCKEISDYIPLLDDNSIFKENGKCGVRNNVLDIVMLKPQYDEILDISENRIVECPYSVCKIRLGNKYGIALTDKDGGKVICPPIYDDITLLNDYLEFNSPLCAYVIKFNGKYGLSLGYKIDLEPIYDKITPLKGDDYNFIIQKEEKSGLYYNGRVIEAEYDEIQIPSLLGWIKARKGNVWGFFDMDYQFTEDLSKAYLIREHSMQDFSDNSEYISKFLFDAFSTFVEELGIYNRIKNNQTESIHYIGKDENAFDYEQQTVFNKAFFYEKNGKIGLRQIITGIDLIPPLYEELYRNYPSGYYRYKRNGKYGFVIADGKGTELTPPIYDEVKELESMDVVLVRQGNKWGIIDWWDTNMIFPLEVDYDEIILDDSRHDSVGLLIKKEGKLGYYKGETLKIPPIYDGLFIPEVFGWVRVFKNGKWGYLDVNNEFTLDVSNAFCCYD